MSGFYDISRLHDSLQSLLQVGSVKECTSYVLHIPWKDRNLQDSVLGHKSQRPVQCVVTAQYIKEASVVADKQNRLILRYPFQTYDSALGTAYEHDYSKEAFDQLLGMAVRLFLILLSQKVQIQVIRSTQDDAQKGK